MDRLKLRNLIEGLTYRKDQAKDWEYDKMVLYDAKRADKHPSFGFSIEVGLPSQAHTLASLLMSMKVRVSPSGKEVRYYSVSASRHLSGREEQEQKNLGKLT